MSEPVYADGRVHLFVYGSLWGTGNLVKMPAVLPKYGMFTAYGSPRFIRPDPTLCVYGELQLDVSDYTLMALDSFECLEVDGGEWYVRKPVTVQAGGNTSGALRKRVIWQSVDAYAYVQGTVGMKPR